MRDSSLSFILISISEQIVRPETCGPEGRPDPKMHYCENM
jgi:hypothetical protein